MEFLRKFEVRRSFHKISWFRYSRRILATNTCPNKDILDSFKLLLHISINFWPKTPSSVIYYQRRTLKFFKVKIIFLNYAPDKIVTFAICNNKIISKITGYFTWVQYLALYCLPTQVIKDYDVYAIYGKNY